MKLELLKNVVTSKVGRQILLAKKNSPTIFFVGGIVGVVATTVLASKATLELDPILEEAKALRQIANETEAEGKYEEGEYRKDQFLIMSRAAVGIGKLYAPSVIVGVASITALTGAHVTLSRRNAAIMAAYSALDKGFKEYRDRVKEELGEDQDLKFRHGTTPVEETVQTKEGKPKTVEYEAVDPDTPSIYAKFFDDGSKEWQREAEYNRIFLSCQQNYCNDLLRSRGHVFLNEVYDKLGLPRTKAGAVVGWILGPDNDNFIDFGVFDGNNWKKRDFVNGHEGSILLDFNVDGVIYDQI